LIEGVVSAHGRLDYAFNNGGSGGASAPITKISEAAWRKTIDRYEALGAVDEAFDAACKALDDTGQPQIVREVIAQRIIEAARRRERDPVRLVEAALPWLTRENKASGASEPGRLRPPRLSAMAVASCLAQRPVLSQ
jgi:NAD(P)-dependent dehydrogenase (short-subunit alcohol dehydrogenase family)